MKIRWVVVGLLCGVAAITTTWYWKNKMKEPTISLNCQSQGKFIFNERPDSPIFQGTYTLMFDNNGSGTISLAGMLTMGTSHYRVLRTAIMQYQTIDVENGLFNLSHTGDAIQDYDNAPKDVIDTYLLRGTDGKTKRVFRAMPLNDHAYLVGNAYSPVMVCSKVNG
ncbi:hypothetical protein SOASR032_05280 [Pragia fontium]|uniref:FidL-like membrane protein n=2 Tax=Pragia fontium TaxID=82985 RepID=A0ABQ5LEC9_9GAMM|nr:hypothetical protein SOASR032_05280 [Pragia fontium]VEJ55019.1 Uncharacterised protein [Pragia fontium]